MRTVKTLIRLGGCPGWSESSLGAQSFCWFCHVMAHLVTHTPFQPPMVWYIFVRNHYPSQWYCKFPKYTDTPKICCNRSKIWTMCLYHRVISPNSADGMANSVALDQSSLIWVCTVCPGISVRKLRIITVRSFLESMIISFPLIFTLCVWSVSVECSDLFTQSRVIQSGSSCLRCLFTNYFFLQPVLILINYLESLMVGENIPSKLQYHSLYVILSKCKKLLSLYHSKIYPKISSV